MKKTFHASGTRGEANHGWLHAKHSFSFAQFFNPERIQFGALRLSLIHISEPTRLV